MGRYPRHLEILLQRPTPAACLVVRIGIAGVQTVAEERVVPIFVESQFQIRRLPVSGLRKGNGVDVAGVHPDVVGDDIGRQLYQLGEEVGVGAGGVAVLPVAVLLTCLVRTGYRAHLQVRRAEDRVLGLDVDHALLFPRPPVEDLLRVRLVVHLHRHDLLRPQVLHRVYRRKPEDQRSVDVRSGHALPGDPDFAGSPVHFHARHLPQQVDGIVALIDPKGGGVIYQGVAPHRHHRRFSRDRGCVQGLDLPLPGNDDDILPRHQHERFGEGSIVVVHHREGDVLGGNAREREPSLVVSLGLQCIPGCDQDDFYPGNGCVEGLYSKRLSRISYLHTVEGLADN